MNLFCPSRAFYFAAFAQKSDCLFSKQNRKCEGFFPFSNKRLLQADKILRFCRQNAKLQSIDNSADQKTRSFVITDKFRSQRAKPVRNVRLLIDLKLFMLSNNYVLFQLALSVTFHIWNKHLICWEVWITEHLVNQFSDYQLSCKILSSRFSVFRAAIGGRVKPKFELKTFW